MRRRECREDAPSRTSYRLWFHERYRDRRAVIALRRQFLRAQPFPHVVLPTFLDKTRYLTARKGLVGQVFARRDTDLFSFWQTADLRASSDKRIQTFLGFLRSEAFHQLVNAVTGVRTAVGRVDASGYCYTDGDHLLCHTDETDSRQIAFVMHFSSLATRDGGALCLFASRHGAPTTIVRRMLPNENGLVLMAVTRRSHHMVEEVLSTKERLTIAGWLHASYD